MFFWNYLITIWYGNIFIPLCLVTLIFCYSNIFLNLRNCSIQVHNNLHQGQPRQASALNIARYRKTVSSAMWVQLVGAMWCSGGFDLSDRVLFSYFHCFGVFLDFSLPKLVIKPDSLLLEDMRSEASNKGHSQRALLFIELILLYMFYFLIIVRFVSPQAVH